MQKTETITGFKGLFSSFEPDHYIDEQLRKVRKSAK